MKKVAKKETPVENPVEEAEEVTEVKTEEGPEVKTEEAKEKPTKKIATNWKRIKSHVRRFVRKHFLATFQSNTYHTAVPFHNSGHLLVQMHTNAYLIHTAF